MNVTEWQVECDVKTTWTKMPMLTIEYGIPQH